MGRKSGTRSSSSQDAKKMKGDNTRKETTSDDDGSLSENEMEVIKSEEDNNKDEIISVEDGDDDGDDEGENEEDNNDDEEDEDEGEEDGEDDNKESGKESPSKRRDRSNNGKFDLMTNSDHDSSRIGDTFQAEIPPFSELVHNTRGKGSGELETMKVLWSDEVMPRLIDLDSYLSRCRELRSPSAGSVLRAQNAKGTVYWCVFLRDISDTSSSTTSAATSSTLSSAASSNVKTVRVFGGEKFELKAHNIPFSSLIGWSDEAECLELLASTHFDQEKALKKLAATYQENGYWRDKFSAWKKIEVEMLCDGASHNNDLESLVDTITSKTKKQIMEFYNHLLRVRGSDFNIVTRLFTAAEKAKETDGLEDPIDQNSDLREGQLRKSKRERSGGRIRLPGEALSEDEETGIEALTTSQALAQQKNNKSTNSSSSRGSSKANSSSSKSKGGKTESKKQGAISKSELAKRVKAVNSSFTSSKKGSSSSSKRGDKGDDNDAKREENAETWTSEYLEQHKSTTPRQKEVLNHSFAFLYQAQQVMEPQTFVKLIQALVDYDNSRIDVSKLMEIASQCLNPLEDSELLESFASFLPDRAKTIFEKCQENDAF